MTTLKRATAATLLALRWLLLAVATGAVWAATQAKSTADTLRP